MDLRTRIWAALRNANGARVCVVALAASLGTTPEACMAAVMDELLDGTIYADPNGDGPGFTPRRFPND